MNKQITKQITKNLKLRDAKMNAKVCVDQKVCEIVYKNKTFNVPQKVNWERAFIEKKTNHRIIIILESPHVDEFKSVNPEPARGKTGDNIGNYLKELLLTISCDSDQQFIEGHYDLILMNAIQSQCSMGIPTKYFRDLSFIGLWFGGGKKQFVDRLEKLKLTKNDFVINSCTKGDISQFSVLFGEEFSQNALIRILDNNNIRYNKGNELRDLVNSAILEAQRNRQEKFKLFRTPHPSCWHFKKQRRILNTVHNK